MGLITSDHGKRWPGGCVIWRFHEGLSEDERAVFENAMIHWTNNSDGKVRFVERTNQPSFITFKTDSVIDNVNHSSSIGMGGGEQFVLLDPITESDGRGRSARHEIGHALGLHHEHKRCDRDDFVRVNESKLKLERVGDFAKMCGDNVRKVGNYDFASIMHYNKARNATADGDALTGSNEANQSLLDDSNMRRVVSDGDRTAVAELHGGTAHVYQLTGDGRIEKTVRQSEWSGGWTTATPFVMDVRNFLFLLKRSNGRMHVDAIEFDGTIAADPIDNRDWSSGWTTAIKYAVGPVNYFLLYKRDNGTVHIHNIDLNGKIGPKIADVDIEPGWTTIRAYAVGLNNFLVFINADTGAMRVRRINWDGKIGESIQASTWSAGWTSVEPYSIGGQDYLFRLKASNGTVSIRRIDGDGKLASETDNADWPNGFTSAAIYEVGGSRYVFLVGAQTGRVEIRGLTSNGKIGSRTDRREFGPGWTHCCGVQGRLGHIRAHDQRESMSDAMAFAVLE